MRRGFSIPSELNTTKRVVAYGYRYDEVPLPAVVAIKQDAKVTIRTMPVVDLRPPVAVSTGVHCTSAALPHSDPKDVPTSVSGAQKRFMTKPPPIDLALLAELRDFVEDWCEKNLVPLSPDSDTSVESWLSKCPYTEARKIELKKCHDEMTDPRDPAKRYLRCKSFIKDETYTAYKHSRIISSRTDPFKTCVGPIIRLIEEVVFKNPAFIKKVPIADRPRYIREMLELNGAQYYAADYVSFESLFVRLLMENVEFVLYKYMTKDLPDGHYWYELMREALLGENECEFKDFLIKVIATRMSGEMNTSLGNGFANLMVLLFLGKKKGCKQVKCVVEGDDSAARFDGPRPDAADFARLGLNCKVEHHDSIETMSFCGIVFDSTDLINVTNPLEVVASFGWSCQRYVKSKDSRLKILLRCKALSLAHQYPGCPIISNLAQYGLRITRSHDIRGHVAKARMSLWEREQLLDALRDEKKIVVVPSPMNTRLLVEKLYGLTVHQQLLFEAYLDACNVVAPIPLAKYFFNVPEEWLDYSHKYVRSVDVRSKFLDTPTGFVSSMDFVQNVNHVPRRESWSPTKIRR